MSNKIKVKNKIIKYCKKYNLEIPVSWDYESVKKISKKINEKADMESWEESIKQSSNFENI